MSEPPQPSPSSLAHREHISRLISPLKRVRPHAPFFRLAAHRVPTLWTLYRGLLRFAPNKDIRHRVGRLFRKYQHLTSPTQTKVQLEKGHRWLDIFSRAHQGGEHLQSVLARYGKMLAARREKDDWIEILRAERAWDLHMRTRPILTGSHMRATIYNGPLPVLKPQPVHITMMIRNRRRARNFRLERQLRLFQWREDLAAEAHFENTLATTSPVPFELEFGGPHAAVWAHGIKTQLDQVQEAYTRDYARARQQFDLALLEKIKEARRERIRNKTRERERERRGEVLNITLKRRRLGYPAHVLSKWSPKERRDRLLVRRSASEVGYVGMLKRKLGWKIREEEDQVSEEDKKRLDKMLRELRAENERRRRLADTEERTLARRKSEPPVP